MDDDRDDTLFRQRVVVTTAFFTGFSGLVYEVTWQRYLANLLGSQAKSHAIVLAVFLGGLAFGYRLFGKLTRGRSPRDLVALCGLAEIVIGAWALFFPMLYDVLWSRIGVIDPMGLSSLVPDLLLAVLLIGVPTLLMGCTLPLLTQGISTGDRNTSLVHAKIYTWNTGGAFLGCLVGGFFLLPRFGLPLTDMNMAAVNLLCGLVLLVVSKGLSAEGAESAADALGEIEPTRAGLGGIGLAFLAGFTGLTFQIVLIRVTGIAMGSSEFTFSMIVSIYILMLALGASGLSRVETTGSFRALAKNQAQITLGTIAFYFVVPSLPYLNLILRSTFTTNGPAFYAYNLAALVGMGCLLAIPLLGVGKTMPLLFSTLGPKLSQSGRYVGRLYCWNALGCVLGALVGGYLLLGFFNLDVVLKITVFLGLVSFAIALAMLGKGASNRNQRQLAAAAGLLIVAIFVGVTPAWNPDYMGIGLFKYQTPFAGMFDGHAAVLNALDPGHVLFRRDDPNTSVSVVRAPSPTLGGPDYSKALLVNGKSDGSTAGVDMSTTRLLAHIPMLLGDFSSAKVAVVGFGTGITPGSLSLYDEVKEINCIEISSAVQEFSSEFAFANHDVTRNPKFHWQNADAYRWLASRSEPFDIIISEPSNPWVGGVERLYTREFYERAARSLGESGMFAQWFHTYQISPSTLSMVLKTFSSVFPDQRVFTAPNSNDLIIIGSKRPIRFIGEKKFQERLASSARLKKDLGEIGIVTPESFLSMELPFGPEMVADAAEHTLDFPLLSFAAARDFFGMWNSSLSRIAAMPAFVPFVGVYKRESLLNRFYESDHPRDGSRLIQLARMHCEGDPARLAPMWKTQTGRCRELLLALIATNQVAASSADTEVALVRDLAGLGAGPDAALEHGRNRKVAGGVDPIARARGSVLAFAEFDSAFLELGVKRVIERAKPCFEAETPAAFQCRAYLTEALVRNGYGQEASEQLAALMKATQSVPKATSERLAHMIEESLVAHKRAAEKGFGAS